MIAIVNADLDWAIGKNGDLINKFPEDMNFFKNKTNGHTLIYGRKTLESFPNGAPLKNRKNIVITSNSSNIKEDATRRCNFFGCMEKCRLIDKCMVSTILMNDPNDERTPTDGNTVLISTTDIKSAVDISKIIGEQDKVFVIGGESIYKAILPYCDTVYLTRCYSHTEDADAFFPNIDNLPDWKIVSRDGGTFSSTGIEYEFMMYQRVK